MSKMHKFTVKHSGMTKEQIESCNCELCQTMNVGKNRRRTVPKEKSMEDIAREMGITL